MINQITCTSNNAIELSRGELIGWINNLLRTNISKIQQLGTGVIYCQLLDLLYPGKVPLAKINFKAKLDYEYVNNFKILQQSFTKLNIMKHIDVEKLVKCKYQDNLQFLQWFKKIFDTSYVKENQPRKLHDRKPSGVFTSVSSYDNSETVLSDQSNQQYIPQWKDNDDQKIDDISNTINKWAFDDQREFYLKKFKEIEHLMEMWDIKKSSQELIGNIRQIILAPPETNWKVDDGKFEEIE